MSISLKADPSGTSGTIQINGVDKVVIGDQGISQGAPAGFRNLIINGGFGVNQRAVSGTVTLTAGSYGHDRWKAGASGCTYTFATTNGLTTLTITAGSLQQVVEDKNVPAGTNTLIMSWTGTAQGKIGAGSYAASGVTGSVTGGSHLTVEFGTGTLANVQLEKGTVATPFEFRPYGTELAMCQRYYFKGQVLATTSANSHTISLPSPMRAAPTISVLALAAGSGASYQSSGSLYPGSYQMIYQGFANTAAAIATIETSGTEL